MRFRKSIKIMKGVKLNFSKSGLSLTAGVPGVSVNFGSKGTYLNTGIPGTGLYDRKRIGGARSSRHSSSRSSRSNIKMNITVGIHNDGTYFIKDQYGKDITDETQLRKIKRTEDYKSKIVQLGKRFVAGKIEENHAFIDIYKLSPNLIDKKDVIFALEHMKPQVCQKRLFEGEEPDEMCMKKKLEAEAKRNIWSIAFWTLKKRRGEYVNNMLATQFEAAMQRFNEERDNFLKKEMEIEAQQNREYVEEFEKTKIDILAYLKGDQKWVEKGIDIFLEDMTLPVNFSVSYDYDSGSGNLKVDLDLPEIEDIPTTKAATMAGGKVKVKDKTQKEIKEEYLRCISGLAFFFASSFFNISTHISNILISGFTQRLNKKTGNIEDEYVYSVIFTRKELESMKICDIDPISAFENFHHKRNISKGFDISTITPLEVF